MGFDQVCSATEDESASNSPKESSWIFTRHDIVLRKVITTRQTDALIIISNMQHESRSAHDQNLAQVEVNEMLRLVSHVPPFQQIDQ